MTMLQYMVISRMEKSLKFEIRRGNENKNFRAVLKLQKEKERKNEEEETQSAMNTVHRFVESI